PEATVTILSGMTTYKLHASDYKSLLVIGEDQFSCEWKNRLVSVNYRAVGKIQNRHLEMFERACGDGCPPGSAGRMLGLLTQRDNLIPRRRRLIHGENCLELQICAFRRLHDLCNTPTAFK